MPLISEEYRSLNAQLHAESNAYGRSGQHFTALVRMLAERIGTRDILDYGCGKRTLENRLGFPINNYDPCIIGHDRTPAPAALVVCTETLEHVEPECLEAVLDDLRRVTAGIVVMSIATAASSKRLPDGRNSHLIQQTKGWWLYRIGQHFDVMRLNDLAGGGILVIAKVSGTGGTVDLDMLPSRMKPYKEARWRASEARRRAL